MSDHVVVKVAKADGSALSVGGAALSSDAASHAFADVAGQGLSLDLAGVDAGRYALVLEVGGHPSLPFSVIVAEKRGAKSIAFVRPRPRCCAPSKQAAASGADASRRLFVLAFTLTPKHEEVVFVSGWDYSGGGNTIVYPKTWRDDLYRGKTNVTGKSEKITPELFDHSVVTIFEADTGLRMRFIRGVKGWHLMDSVLQGTVPTHTKWYKKPANTKKRHDDDSFSIVHVYDYIIELGATVPGALKRLDFFSHAWPRGPILVNTNQDPEFDTGARKDERDPGDKDARGDKDFTAVNMPRIAEFKAAFAPGAVGKIWGCFYHQELRNIVQGAAEAKDPDKERKYPWNDDVVTISAKKTVEVMRTKLMPNSYMGRLAKAAGITVWGVPLGLGSDVKSVGRRWYMFVNPRRFKSEYGWYKQHFGLTPDPSGYVEYKP